MNRAPASLDEVLKRRKARPSGKAQSAKSLSLLDKAAVLITRKVGTMGFFIMIFLWTVLWLGWNILAPTELRFDPPTGFVFWLFISNLIQLLLMPLIMVGQNVQGEQADARAERDLEVNIQAESEIEVILQHLEYQNEYIIRILEAVSGDKVKPGLASKRKIPRR